jgi:hypothetical protein
VCWSGRRSLPSSSSVFLCASTGISFLPFLVAYIYLFATDREMLRAERYRGRKFGGRALTVESQETTELYLGDRGDLGLERAASVVAPLGEGESRARGASRGALDK